jgi:hypothetical protein
VKTYDFDGQQMTVPQIHERVPAISEATVRRMLKRGLRTSSAMLAFDVSAANRRGGQRTSAKKRGWGFA